MGEALEVLLMGSAKLESVPLPDIDPTESAEKQQYARTMHELKATLQATKPDDDATWDSMLQKHRATGGAWPDYLFFVHCCGELLLLLLMLSDGLVAA